MVQVLDIVRNAIQGPKMFDVKGYLHPIQVMAAIFAFGRDRQAPSIPV